MSKQILTHEHLTSILDYSPETGQFTRRKTTALRGNKVGDMMANGYLRIGIDRKRYLAHRLAWFYTHKEWPKHEIDHINQDKADNRIANLRDVQGSENQHNRGPQVTNRSGHKGVSWCKRTSKWVAQIAAQRQTHFLGRYDSIKAAAAAYADARRVYHPTAPI